jgi:hypothetical protein
VSPEILGEKVEPVDTIIVEARANVTSAQEAVDDAENNFREAQIKAREIADSMPELLKAVLFTLEGEDAIEFEFLIRILGNIQNKDIDAEFSMANLTLELLKTLAEEPFIAVSSEIDNRVGRSIAVYGANTIVMDRPVMAAIDRGNDTVEYVIQDDEDQSRAFGIGKTKLSGTNMSLLFEGAKCNSQSVGFEIISGYDQISRKLSKIKSEDMVAFLAIVTGYDWPAGSLGDVLRLDSVHETNLKYILVTTMAKMYVKCGFGNFTKTRPMFEMSKKADGIVYDTAEKPYVG